MKHLRQVLPLTLTILASACSAGGKSSGNPSGTANRGKKEVDSASTANAPSKSSKSTAPSGSGGRKSDAAGLALNDNVVAANTKPGCTKGYDTVVGLLHAVAGPGCNQKLIVTLHGGAWTFGKASDLDVFINPMKAAGIIYVSLEYTNGAPMATILDQVIQTFNILRLNALVVGFDPNKMGVMGFSAGGHLAMQAGIMDGKVRWIGSLSGPADLAALDTYMCPANTQHADLCQDLHNAVGGTPADHPDAYKQYSPQFSVAGLTSVAHAPSFYIGHGDADEVVPVTSADQFNTTLSAMGVPVNYRRNPGTDHVGTFLALTTEIIGNAAGVLDLPPNAPAHAADGGGGGDGSSSDSVPHGTLYRCYNASNGNHNYVLDPSQCGTGFAPDGASFGVIADGVPGTHQINLYTVAGKNFLLTPALAATIPGLALAGRLGNLFDSQQPGTSEFVICTRDADGLQGMSRDPGCENVEGFRNAASAGWGF